MQFVTSGILQFLNGSTAGNATITNNSGGTTFFFGTSSGGTARLIANGTGAVDFSFRTSTGTTAGSFEGSGNFFLGSKTITVGGNNLSTTVSGVIQNGGFGGGAGGGLIKTGAGIMTLSGVNTYTGSTTVNAGALIVDGSIASSALTMVNGGGLLGGVGTVGNTQINAGGTFAPGPQNAPGAMTVAGNLAFQPGAFYLVQVNPSTASIANVTGTATLAGNVLATFAPGSYITRQYTILHADQGVSGAFAGLSANTPANFSASLSYGANDVFLNLTAALGNTVTGLNQNQVNVANALNGFFNKGGALPPNFASLFGLTGTNLATALSQLSGEAATAAQYGAFQLGNLFFSLMLDPLVYGRSPNLVAPAGVGPMRLAAEGTQPPEIALAYAKILKEPPAPGPILWEPRWNVWAGGYGGYNRTQGDPVFVGSHDVTARTGGYGAGIDYRIWPGTTLGVALAGGLTNWGLASGLGRRQQRRLPGRPLRHRTQRSCLCCRSLGLCRTLDDDRPLRVRGRSSHGELQRAELWRPHRGRLALCDLPRRGRALRGGAGASLPHARLQRDGRHLRRLRFELQCTQWQRHPQRVGRTF